MEKSPEFLIETILPSGEVSLLGGPSGSGKSRWLFDTLLDWEASRPVLGFRSYPVPWIYIASDRTVKSVQRTWVSMGIDPERITYVPSWNNSMGIDEIMDVVDKSPARLVVIESFGSFVPARMPAGKDVKAFLGRMSNWCQRHDKTILGVVESPKLKPNEKYENPRQRISGVAAWGHFSETIFLIEPEDVTDGSNINRIMNICPRNAPTKTINLRFNENGRLEVNVFHTNVTDGQSRRR